MRAILNNKVFRNFSYLTVGSSFSQLIGVFTIIKITNLFSPESYGSYTFMQSQASLLFVVADLGITNVIIRSIARDNFRTNDLIFNGAIIRLLSVLILSAVYILYNHFLGNLTSVQMFYVFSFAFINCIAHLFEIAFLGNQKMLPTSLINLAYSIVWFLIVYIVPFKYTDVTILFGAFVVVNLLKAIASFFVLKYQKLLVGQIQKLSISCKGLLKESWPYFSLVLILTPVNYLSNNFLSLNSNIVQVGYFNLSQKLMLPINLVLSFAFSAIFPNLSSLWIKDEKKFYHIVSIGFKYFMVATSIMCFLFTFFIREIVLLIFKASYLPAVQVCQLQVWFVFLMGINSLIGTILGAVNKEKIILKLGIVNALISTPMLYWGSKYGAVGLSYGYVISFAVFEFYCWAQFKKIIAVQIKKDWLFWGVVLLLFCISYFIKPINTLALRIILSSLIIGIASFYFIRDYKLAMK